MSQCIHLAFVLSLAMCEHEAKAPPPPEPPAAKPVVVSPAPEPAYEEVRLMTRAGPKWVKRQTAEPPRVRREPIVAEQPAKP